MYGPLSTDTRCGCPCGALASCFIMVCDDDGPSSCQMYAHVLYQLTKCTLACCLQVSMAASFSLSKPSARGKESRIRLINVSFTITQLLAGVHFAKSLHVKHGVYGVYFMCTAKGSKETVDDDGLMMRVSFNCRADRLCIGGCCLCKLCVITKYAC